MSETQAHLLMIDGKAVQAAFYDGVVGLGEPQYCPIARFYHERRKYPLLAIDGEDVAGKSNLVELDAEEIIALYDALTPRIAYLRECAAREAGE